MLVDEAEADDAAEVVVDEEDDNAVVVDVDIDVVDAAWLVDEVETALDVAPVEVLVGAELVLVVVVELTVLGAEVMDAMDDELYDRVSRRAASIGSSRFPSPRG